MLLVCVHCFVCVFCFFCTDPATTEIYTLSLHDALPIYLARDVARQIGAEEDDRTGDVARRGDTSERNGRRAARRSEEHTSELQSRFDLVCRLLLEKKKQKNTLRTKIVLT